MLKVGSAKEGRCKAARISTRESSEHWPVEFNSIQQNKIAVEVLGESDKAQTQRNEN